MKKKSLKKKMAMALAGIILAGSIGWSQIPAQAAVNRDVICAHENAITTDLDKDYIQRNSQGHIVKIIENKYCSSCDTFLTYISDGNFETHYFHWDLVEDRGDGLYEFRIWCACGYEDEVASDDPEDPKI